MIKLRKMRKYTVLWNTNDANYGKRQHRDAAMRKLSAELGSRCKLVTCRMQYFRIYFRPTFSFSGKYNNRCCQHIVSRLNKQQTLPTEPR